MKAMTSSAAIRTRDATGTPPLVTRRRTVSPSRPVRPTTTPTRTPRTSATRNGAVSGQTARSGTAAFALLVVGLLGGALVGLLLLNTTLAQQSFERSELQQENQRLEERRQALQEDIARESSPEVLHAKARRLGMRDAGDPALAGPRTGR
jgi:hypothetical protein